MFEKQFVVFSEFIRNLQPPLTQMNWGDECFSDDAAASEVFMKKQWSCHWSEIHWCSVLNFKLPAHHQQTIYVKYLVSHLLLLWWSVNL